jgi:hypothetical protein
MGRSVPYVKDKMSRWERKFSLSGNASHNGLWRPRKHHQVSTGSLSIIDAPQPLIVRIEDRDDSSLAGRMGWVRSRVIALWRIRPPGNQVVNLTRGRCEQRDHNRQQSVSLQCRFL